MSVILSVIIILQAIFFAICQVVYIFASVVFLKYSSITSNIFISALLIIHEYIVTLKDFTSSNVFDNCLIVLSTVIITLQLTVNIIAKKMSLPVLLHNCKAPDNFFSNVILDKQHLFLSNISPSCQCVLAGCSLVAELSAQFQMFFFCLSYHLSISASDSIIQKC